MQKVEADDRLSISASSIVSAVRRPALERAKLLFAQACVAAAVASDDDLEREKLLSDARLVGGNA